ncbi:MAG: bifunctional aspartate kinase/homoserine dehydrogenase I [Planctomycetes bacterium]|nr:bifunctional aspartate kinase/homoserine dehydrogenase I [Planctomycetota bacterium]
MSPTTPPTVAHKFGGSSLRDADRIARVVDIVRGRDGRQVVVVSAMGGVTDALIALVERAACADEDWQGPAGELERRHLAAADALLADGGEAVRARLAEEFTALRELLHAQSLIGAVSPDLLQLVAGLGEIWSALLVDGALRAAGADSRWLDARDVLVVTDSELGATVNWEPTRARLLRHAEPAATVTVIPGFVARTPDGRVTNLGRNGSDYSGAIFAALFEADELHVWSDVDGILSADPRVVPEAVEIPQLSYSEACELAYFGAKVLHPQTMAPAIERGITIFARNTFDPAHPGTRIAAAVEPEPFVKGVSTVGGLAILNLEGAGMIGVPGTAQRVFSALEQASVSVVMISQGSSEHSICVVIRAVDAELAEQAVRRTFAHELRCGQVSDVTVEGGIAALAAVGDGMAGRPGVASQMFAALARANVNVRVIAQGASERNISVALDEASARRALRAVHAGFYLSAQTVSVGVIGPGNVGRAFLRQLHEARPQLLEQNNLDLRVRAIAGSRRMTLFEDQDGGYERELDRDTDLAALTAHVHAEHLPHTVIVDCSASDAVADRYADWLSAGIHVITPNKHAGSGPFERYEALRRQPGQFCYEATVGAGLPIITTLRDLIDTGDRVLAIDGILSGTLAFLFERFDGSQPFSALVRDAMARGFTEPDPRDDLSGLDVARKLVIMARENGWRIGLEHVQLESLVPESLQGGDKQAFLANLDRLDAPLAERLAAAQQRGCVLRYVARLEAGGEAVVGLTEVTADHALANIRPTDNVVQFTTERYRDNPLVVRGPGAGPDATAMGIFADLLRVASALGARR